MSAQELQKTINRQEVIHNLVYSFVYTAMAGDPKKLDLVKAIRYVKYVKNQGAGVQNIVQIMGGHYKGSILKPEVRSWTEWSTTKLNDEMKNAAANQKKAKTGKPIDNKQ